MLSNLLFFFIPVIFFYFSICISYFVFADYILILYHQIILHRIVVRWLHCYMKLKWTDIKMCLFWLNVIDETLRNQKLDWNHHNKHSIHTKLDRQKGLRASLFVIFYVFLEQTTSRFLKYCFQAFFSGKKIKRRRRHYKGKRERDKRKDKIQKVI